MKRCHQRCLQSTLARSVRMHLVRFRLITYRQLGKPIYLCVRAAQNWDGRLACVASRQGARSASHRVMHSPNQVLTHAARAAAPFQPPLVAARGAREGLWLEQGYAGLTTGKAKAYLVSKKNRKTKRRKRASPVKFHLTTNQMLTHAARADAKGLPDVAWPAARVLPKAKRPRGGVLVSTRDKRRAPVS